MHSAPSVNYPVGRSRKAERLLMLLWALGVGCVTLACVRSGGEVDWRQAMLAFSAIVAGAAAWTGVLRSSAAAELRFDGQAWSITGGAAQWAARASVALDLQSLLLVRLAGPARARRWIWLDRQAMPERWSDLRRALYSRAAAAESVHRPDGSVHHPSP